MRTTTQDKHQIPKQLVVDLILRLREQWPEESLEDISIQCGFSKEWLRTVIANTRKSETLGFWAVDKLLCKLNLVHLWYEPPLEEHYWPEGVPPDKSKPVQCASPLCDEWFALEHRGTHRRFCCHSCAVYTKLIEMGERRSPKQIKEEPHPNDPWKNRRCLHCNRHFEREPSSRSQFCSPKCKKARKRETSKRWWKEHGDKYRCSDTT